MTGLGRFLISYRVYVPPYLFDINFPTSCVIEIKCSKLVEHKKGGGQKVFPALRPGHNKYGLPPPRQQIHSSNPQLAYADARVESKNLVHYNLRLTNKIITFVFRDGKKLKVFPVPFYRWDTFRRFRGLFLVRLCSSLFNVLLAFYSFLLQPFVELQWF